MQATTPMAHRNDDALIQAILAGSPEAFEDLYERHFPRVFGFVSRRLSDRSDVEDVVQNVFVHALTNLSSYRGEGTFLRWLYGITRNLLRRHYLKKNRAAERLGRTRLDVTESPDVLQDEVTPERQYEARQLGRKAAEKLEKLSPDARETFLQHHLDGVPIGELSERTARSPDSLKSDFYRIRRRLAEDD